MGRKVDRPHSSLELSDEDQEHIRTIFEESMVPKLLRCGARIGNLNCEFAGHRYKDWTIQFRSTGSEFEIVEFEYDEDGEGLSLDL
jgi:hypothetical protein